MTLKEKLQKEHPELDIEKAVAEECPSDFGLMEDPENDEEGLCSMMCNECWARKVESDTSSTAEAVPLPLEGEGCAPVIRMIEVEKIFPHPDNPRKDLGDLTELAESIKESGIMQNLTVVPGSYGYTAVIGHRRLAAAKLAGLRWVPCVVRAMSEKEQQAVMLAENIQRNNLTLREQAEGLQKMFDLGADMQEVKKRTGFSESTIRRRINLFKLDGDELDKAEARGGTLDDYMKLMEIEGEEQRNYVLSFVGTSDFDWKLKNVLAAQDREKRKAVFLEKVKEFAEALPEGAEDLVKESVYYNFSEMDFKPVEGERYFYKDDGYSIHIYREKTQWEKEDSYVKDMQKKHEEEIKRYNEERCKELFKVMYEKRNEFVGSVIGKNISADKLIAFMVEKKIHISFDHEKSVRARMGLLSGYEDMSLTEAAEEKYGDKACGNLLFLFLYEDYYDSENDCCWSNYDGKYREDGSLIELYDLLEAVGMEVSDEEAALLNGDHEVYKVN